MGKLKFFDTHTKLALKNSYVDVFNPSGAPSKPAEKVMAPTMPDQGAIPKYGFFMPDPSAATAAAGTAVDQQAQPNVSKTFYLFFYKPIGCDEITTPETPSFYYSNKT